MACTLAVSFGLYTAEALLADTHDGDATHEELARADGAGEHAKFHASHGDESSTTGVGAELDAPANHPGERAPGQSGHEQHACHCAHVHSGWLQAPVSNEPNLLAGPAAAIAFREQVPVSRRGEPQLRPPIA